MKAQDQHQINPETQSCQTSVMVSAVDNLQLLLSQPDESIDLIYCDILYGTGRKFNDYQDLKPNRSEIENHYIPRLKEMHRVLKNTGSIYLQMDTKINHWVRCIMDDIFGYELFKNEIYWHYSDGTAPKGAFKRKTDNILFYTKSNISLFNVVKIPVLNAKRYNKVDENGDLYFEDGHNKTAKRYYLKNGIIADNVWSFLNNNNFRQLNSNSKERIGYDTQKPKALIERIIKASSNEGDTVADYYLGSGTTAVVCKELNRNFIGCDINPKAIEITNSRLEAVS